MSLRPPKKLPEGGTLRKTWRRRRGRWYLPAMTPSETALDQLAELPTTVERLTQELVVLRRVMDEIREDIGWAVRNAPDLIPALGARRITSMPLDPCAPDWSERLNRLTPADLPPEPGASAARPQKVLVRAEDFERAMESVEQLVYCCESPDLQWTGDPEYPGVECRKCGYIVAEAGSVEMTPVTDDVANDSTPNPAPPSKRQLSEESDEDSEVEEYPAGAEPGQQSTTDDELDDDAASDSESSGSANGDLPPVAADPPRRKPAHSQPLSMRLIFQPHMTDLVRLFRYETLSREEVKKRVEPLMEKYGREKVGDATAEIVEEVAQPPLHYRLTEEARRLSLQILGRPPALDPGKRVGRRKSDAASCDRDSCK